MSKNIMFGVAKDIVTPCVETTMLGFGTVFGKSFTGIHDDLYVKCLLLKDGKQILVLLSLDLCFHDDSLPISIGEYLSEKYQIPYNNLLISYTHTHFGPCLKGYDFIFHSPEYESFLLQRIKDCINRAFLNIYEGTIEYTSILGEWNISRRLKVDDVMQRAILPNPDGECDKNMYLLKLTDKSGNVKVIAINFACHPSNLDSYRILSSEYPGRLCHLIEANNYGCTAVFFQGFGGDSKLKIGAKSSKFHPISYEDCNEVASSMALKIQSSLINKKWEVIQPSLSSRMFQIKIPLEVYPLSFFEKELQNFSDNSKVPFDKNMVKDYESNGSLLMWSNAEYVVNNYDRLHDYLILNCGIIRIGKGHYIFTIGGEPSYDVKKVLQELLPEANVLYFGYNDAIAYVPSDKMLEEGGYEAGDGSVTEYRMKGKFKKGIDNYFLEGFRNALNQL
ncbi:MAG TPA: neutral/alkaline non-lysosomal ceramidase N-terminal domain-containing protein [Clostridiales bacterium]|nr:neutral/alkaline non-lysosomal ceramidase N-terminal domain-containing protein [Clostridiales bacterium]